MSDWKIFMSLYQTSNNSKLAVASSLRSGNTNQTKQEKKYLDKCQSIHMQNNLKWNLFEGWIKEKSVAFQGSKEKEKD